MILSSHGPLCRTDTNTQDTSQGHLWETDASGPVGTKRNTKDGHSHFSQELHYGRTCHPESRGPQGLTAEPHWPTSLRSEQISEHHRCHSGFQETLKI